MSSKNILLSFAGGADALAKTDCFDAVLMSHLRAIRHIRQPQSQHSPERQCHLAMLPVTGINSHAFSKDVARCLEAGMTDRLTKSLSRTVVKNKLVAALAALPTHSGRADQAGR